MKRWNIKVVYFTTSPVLQEACHKYRIDVIKEHLFPFSFLFTVQSELLETTAVPRADEEHEADVQGHLLWLCGQRPSDLLDARERSVGDRIGIIAIILPLWRFASSVCSL